MYIDLKICIANMGEKLIYKVRVVISWADIKSGILIRIIKIYNWNVLRRAWPIYSTVRPQLCGQIWLPSDSSGGGLQLSSRPTGIDCINGSFANMRRRREEVAFSPPAQLSSTPTDMPHSRSLKPWE